jgi:hypothetical protein
MVLEKRDLIHQIWPQKHWLVFSAFISWCLDDIEDIDNPNPDTSNINYMFLLFLSLI